MLLMILDNEEQRTILLQLVNKASFGGDLLEQAYLLKHAIKHAELAKPPQPEPPAA
jgi:hypothetical protein